MLKQIKFLSLSIILLLLSNCGSNGNNVTIVTPASVYNKLIKDMDFNEAREAKQYYEATGNTQYALMAGARMLTLGSTKDADKEIIQNTTLDLARGYLKEDNLEKAKKYALDYQQQYPGSPDLKEASYIALKTHYLSTNDAHRDQTNTLKTIELAQKFLQENKEEDFFRHEAEMIIKASYKKIFESEIYVINCYLARYKYSNFEPSIQAAHKRLAYVKEKLPKIYQDEEEILKLEIALAEAENKTDIATEKKAELIKKNPEYQTELTNTKEIALKL